MLNNRSHAKAQPQVKLSLLRSCFSSVIACCGVHYVYRYLYFHICIHCILRHVQPGYSALLREAYKAGVEQLAGTNSQKVVFVNNWIRCRQRKSLSNIYESFCILFKFPIFITPFSFYLISRKPFEPLMTPGRKPEASSATSWPTAPFLGLGGGHSQKNPSRPLQPLFCFVLLCFAFKTRYLFCKNDEVGRVVDDIIFKILGPWFKGRYITFLAQSHRSFYNRR